MIMQTYVEKSVHFNYCKIADCTFDNKCNHTYGYAYLILNVKDFNLKDVKDPFATTSYNIQKLTGTKYAEAKRLRNR